MLSVYTCLGYFWGFWVWGKARRRVHLAGGATEQRRRTQMGSGKPGMEFSLWDTDEGATDEKPAAESATSKSAKSAASKPGEPFVPAMVQTVQHGQSVEIPLGTESKAQIPPPSGSERMGRMWYEFGSVGEKPMEGKLAGKTALPYRVMIRCGVCKTDHAVLESHVEVMPKKRSVKAESINLFDFLEHLTGAVGNARSRGVAWRRTTKFGAVCPDKECQSRIPQGDGTYTVGGHLIADEGGGVSGSPDVSMGG